MDRPQEWWEEGYVNLKVVGGTRLRPTWFGVVVEKLCEDSDGTRRWVKVKRPININVDVAQ